MAEPLEVEQDPVLEALAILSALAVSSASDLMDLNNDLAGLRRNRLEGWTWQRIIADADTSNPLSLLSKIAADLALACGGFRRALALGLRREGLQITEIASIFEVSRQRVSALVRPNRPSGSGQWEGPAPESMD